MNAGYTRTLQVKHYLRASPDHASEQQFQARNTVRRLRETKDSRLLS